VLKEPTKIERELISFLSKKKIRFCVLGFGGDIDIAISPLQPFELFSLVQEFCQQNNLLLVQMLQHEQSAFYFVMAWFDKDRNVHYLRPDICGDYVCNGRRYLSANDLTQAASGNSEIWTPSPPIDFIYYLIKKIEKLSLESEHGGRLSAAWARDPKGAEEWVRRFWKGKEADLLVKAAATDRWADLHLALPGLRKSLRASASSRSSRSGELNRYLRRVCYPTGLAVAIMKGAAPGRSLAASRAAIDLEPVFRRTRVYKAGPTILHRIRSTLVVSAKPGLFRPDLRVQVHDGQPIDDMVADVNEAILRHMTKRLRRRLKLSHAKPKDPPSRRRVRAERG